MMIEIKHIFEDYSSWSGQEVNCTKLSIIFSDNVTEMNHYSLANSPSISIMDRSTVYLGGTLFIGRSVSLSYQFLLKKMD